MKVEILGCSGGIGQGLKTTTFLVDEHLLLDAGTGVELLTLERMLSIRSVLITHAHIDHIVGLPLMLATIFDSHKHPVDVYALPAVIDALQTHIFNWTVWPDYTQLPEQNPIVRLHKVDIGETLTIADKAIEVLPSAHPTPTAGYIISADQQRFAFTGDTGENDALWPILNERKPDMLVIDVSFTDDEDELARLSGHLTPAQLAGQLQQLSCDPKIWVTHMKPGFEKKIIGQCLRLRRDRPIDYLRQGQLIVL